MTGTVAYILAKKIALSAVSGLKSMTLSPTGQLIFEFNDGNTSSWQIPLPKDGKDGLSVTNIEINANNHLIFTMSDGSTVDSGELLGGTGGGLIQVNSKTSLPTAGAEDTLYLTRDDDILYYWDHKDRLYRPVTGGSGANGIDFTTANIEFDGIEQTFASPIDDKKISIYVNGIYLTENEDYTIDRTVSPNTITFEELWEETDLCTIVWVKGNIAQSDSDLSNYYNKQEIEELIANIDTANELITFKDKIINNIHQLDGIELPCCLHLINCTFGGMFCDDIVYVTSAPPLVRLMTIDNALFEIELDDDGYFIHLEVKKYNSIVNQLQTKVESLSFTLATEEDIDNLFSNLDNIEITDGIYAKEEDIDNLFK